MALTGYDLPVAQTEPSLTDRVAEGKHIKPRGRAYHHAAQLHSGHSAVAAKR